MITIEEAAKASGLSVRRLQVLCKARRIPGAKLLGGRLWQLPEGWKVIPGTRGPKIGA